MKKALFYLITMFYALNTIKAQNQTELWGMTAYGGTSNSGVIFKYDLSNSTYIKKVDLNSTTGDCPYGSLMQASNGMLYGMTFGGTSNTSVLFKYDIDNNTYTKKIDFTGTANGLWPYGSLMEASNGKFYGMTKYGGTGDIGVLFEYDPTTDTLIKKIDFNGSSNGKYPYGDLVEASNGKLYGMTCEGGTNNYGVLFEYDPTTSTYIKKINFFDVSTHIPGGYPQGSLIKLSNGKLYGVTSGGGAYNYGVIFEYDPTTSIYTNKIDFYTNGRYPYGGLVLASNGKLYGTTWAGGINGLGVLYEYNPTTNTYTKRIDFNGSTNGSNPQGSLMMALNGRLYGMTNSGGTYSKGVLFEFIIQTNTFTKILDFNSTNGANPKYTHLIEICKTPRFNSNPQDVIICRGLSTNFTATASGNGLIWRWQVDIGNGFNNLTNDSIYSGVSSSVLLVSGVMSSMHNYKYRCLVKSTCPIDSIISDTAILKVLSLPISTAIAVDTTIFCEGDSVIINANSDTGLTYQWEKENKSIKDATNVTLTAKLTGEYSVMVTDKNNCSQRSNPVSVYAQKRPIITFKINDTIQCLRGNSFVFTNNSTIDSGSFINNWNFGDSTTSLDTNPIKSYLASSTYLVKLITTTNLGCIDSLIKEVYVRPNPISVFNINYSSHCLKGNYFVFTNNSIVSKINEWSFGDSTSSTIIHPTKSYLNYGKYSVKLVTTSEFGCKDSIIQKVDVNPDPIANFTFLSDKQCLSGNSFSFTNYSSIATGLINAIWNFGDGDTSHQFNTVHSYITADTFNVSLHIISLFGCKDSITGKVSVYHQPHVSFTINDTNQCLYGNLFRFNNTSTIIKDSINIYHWDLGDGTNSTTDSNLEHSYLSDTNYLIWLKATSSRNCVDSIAKFIYIKPNPIVNLGFDTSIYDKDSLVLKVKSGFDTYSWSNNDTTNQITIDTTGYGLGKKIFWVKVTQNGCDGSDTIQLTFIHWVSINAPKMSFEARVYPNPVNSILTIELSPIGNEMEISLLDMYGKQLKSIRIESKNSISKHIIDVSELAKGVYFLNILNNEVRKVAKIVKY